MQSVTYKNYTVKQHKSGIIEVSKDGVIILPAKSALSELAELLNVSTKNADGHLHITRQLGILVMKAIKEQNR